MAATLQQTKRYSVYNRSEPGQKAASNPVSVLANTEMGTAPETFSRKLVLPDKDVLLDFAVIKLDQSCFCWCGVNSGSPPRLTSLVVAMTGGKAGPVATTVLGGQIATGEDEATAMRIARRAKLAMIHFSSSFGSENSQEARMFAEKCLVEALTASA